MDDDALLEAALSRPGDASQVIGDGEQDTKDPKEENGKSHSHDPDLAIFAGDCEQTEPWVSHSRGQRNRLHPQNWGYTTYLDRVFKMTCFFDLVRLKVFPDAKDISESYGAIAAGARHCRLGPNAEKASGVLCLAVGDGSTPRTAGLAAFVTRWTCVSIDPCLREEWAGANPKDVRGLHGFVGTFEEWVPEKLQEAKELASQNGRVGVDSKPSLGLYYFMARSSKDQGARSPKGESQAQVKDLREELAVLKRSFAVLKRSAVAIRELDRWVDQDSLGANGNYIVMVMGLIGGACFASQRSGRRGAFDERLV
ncbi:unnamed protein product [Polarella glacialis]|uniref:Uncharacterized protein n=1 Tax=Polarella glacialis TaxID=89957 RepID=A0A813ETD8_POLGL|nr:unnamed protein product [Polarella glacialis]